MLVPERRLLALGVFCHEQECDRTVKGGRFIGVGSVIVMVGVGEGSQAQVAKQIASMGTNLLMVMPPRGARDANRLSRADVKKIKSEAGYIKAISGQTGGSFEVVGGTGN